jgi:putative nucleotidyltransferase with HDIG domain
VRELLSHSLRVALYSQRIAKLAKLNAEEAFLSGLLHDIGYPVMLQAMSDLQRQTPCSISRAALKQAAFDRHAEAGASLASAWAFSPRLISVVKTHHAPLHDEGGTKHAAMVHLADELARPPSADDPESSAPPRDPWSVEALQLSSGDLEALAAQSEEVEKAMRAFG